MGKDKDQAWQEGWPVIKGEGPGKGWWGPPKGTHGPGSQGVKLAIQRLKLDGVATDMGKLAHALRGKGFERGAGVISGLQKRTYRVRDALKEEEQTEAALAIQRLKLDGISTDMGKLAHDARGEGMKKEAKHVADLQKRLVQIRNELRED